MRFASRPRRLAVLLALFGALGATACRRDPPTPDPASASDASADEDPAAPADADPRAPCPTGMVLIPGRTTEPVLDPVCISVLETTVDDYRRCVQAGACSEPPGPSKGFDTYRAEGRGDNPVTGVSLAGAAAYCGFVGGRVPRVSEWRWAFHSGDPPIYPWGDAAGAQARICFPEGESGRTGVGWPCAVGSHPGDRTAQGLLDMGGNAFELTDVDGPEDYEGWSKPMAWANLPSPSDPDASTNRPEKSVTTVPVGRTDTDGVGPFGFRCAADPRGIPPTPRPPKPAPEPDRLYDECPAGMVEIPARKEAPSLGPYCIGETEVTVAQYRACVDAKACEPPDDLGSRWSTWRSGKDEFPLTFADFAQAIPYCRFIGARLPTIDEWVWAYGSAKNWPLPWGEDVPVGTRTCAPTYPREGPDGGGIKPPHCRVRSFPQDRTAQGAYDMAGSLWELVAAETKHKLGGRVMSVRAPNRPVDDVLRYTPEYVRATYTPEASPYDGIAGGDGWDGFRCAVSLTARPTTME